MFRAVIFLTSIFLVACTSIDFSSEHHPQASPVSQSAMIAPFQPNPAVVILAQQLSQEYADGRAQVLRVGNEVKVTYSSDLLFGIGSETLLPATSVDMGPVVNEFKAYPDAVLRVDVFTDTSGDTLKNNVRSEERAKAVALYLLHSGVPSDHLTFKGYGGSYALVDNDTPENRAFNRRVVVTISNIPLPPPAV